MGLSIGPRVGANTLTIGDAAGMVNPFNGEGIAYGYESGRLAAAVLGEALLDDDGPALLALYDERLDAAYGDYYKVARAFVRLISEPKVLAGLRRRGTARRPRDARAARDHGEPHEQRHDGSRRASAIDAITALGKVHPRTGLEYGLSRGDARLEELNAPLTSTRSSARATCSTRPESSDFGLGETADERAQRHLVVPVVITTITRFSLAVTLGTVMDTTPPRDHPLVKVVGCQFVATALVGALHAEARQDQCRRSTS